MFVVTNKICDNLRAKNKWLKTHCLLCATAVSKCRKLRQDEEVENSPDFHPEQEGFIPDKR